MEEQKIAPAGFYLGRGNPSPPQGGSGKCWCLNIKITIHLQEIANLRSYERPHPQPRLHFRATQIQIPIS